MEKLHILSVLLFWREERISSFWVNLYERLEKNETAISYFNSIRHSEPIRNYKMGLLQKIWNPVGEYITQIQIVHNAYNQAYTKDVFNLLRAFRHLVSHPFGSTLVTDTLERAKNSKSKNKRKLKAAKKAKDLQEAVNEKLKLGMVKYWLENFPEFSLITLKAGYDASISVYHQTKIEDSCQCQFLSLTKEVDQIKIPINLYEYSEALSDWILLETGKGKTAIWKYAFTRKIDKLNITFLAIPNHSAVDLGNRELLTLNWIRSTLESSYTLQIARNIVSSSDEIACLFKKSTHFPENIQKGAKTIDLNFKCISNTNTTACFPFIAFSDVIPFAIEACLHNKSNVKHCVIFTNQSSQYIKNYVKQFCDSHSIDYNITPISWDDLNSDYRNELKDESFPIHENFNHLLKLSTIETYFKTIDQNKASATKPGIRLGKNVITSTGTNLGGKIYTETQSFLDINSMLLELMHDKSRLLHTFIKLQGNLLSRSVSLNSEESVTEDELIDSFLKTRNSNQTKNLYLIYGAAYFGKSSFLAKLGNSCINHLVIFTTSSKIMSSINKNIGSSIIEILWQHDKFQQRVAHYVLNSLEYPFTIIIDNFHDLDETERVKFAENFLIPLFINYENLNRNVFLAARSKDILQEGTSKNTVETCTNCKINFIELKEIEDSAKEAYIEHLFRSVNTSLNGTHLNNLVKDCITFLNDEFGQLANTPFVCKIILEIYKDLRKVHQGSLNTEELSGPYIYDKFLNMYIREELAQSLLKDDIPQEFKPDSSTIDMNSRAFQLFKKMFEEYCGHESFHLRFKNKNIELKGLRLGDTNKLLSTPVKYFAETLFPDYYCALLIFKYKTFLTGKVFEFTDQSKTRFEYPNILKFLDALLNAQNLISHFEPNLIRIGNIHEVLSVLLQAKLFNVFFEVVEYFYVNIDTFYIRDHVWPADKVECIETFLDEIIGYSIRKKSLMAVKFIVEVIQFDFRTFKLSEVLKVLKSEVEYDIALYLFKMANNGNIVLREVDLLDIKIELENYHK